MWPCRDKQIATHFTIKRNALAMSCVEIVTNFSGQIINLLHDVNYRQVTIGMTGQFSLYNLIGWHCTGRRFNTET